MPQEEKIRSVRLTIEIDLPYEATESEVREWVDFQLKFKKSMSAKNTLVDEELHDVLDAYSGCVSDYKVETINE